MSKELTASFQILRTAAWNILREFQEPLEDTEWMKFALTHTAVGGFFHLAGKTLNQVNCQGIPPFYGYIATGVSYAVLCHGIWCALTDSYVSNKTLLGRAIEQKKVTEKDNAALKEKIALLERQVASMSAQHPMQLNGPDAQIVYVPTQKKYMTIADYRQSLLVSTAA